MTLNEFLVDNARLKFFERTRKTPTHLYVHPLTLCRLYDITIFCGADGYTVCGLKVVLSTYMEVGEMLFYVEDISDKKWWLDYLRAINRGETCVMVDMDDAVYLEPFRGDRSNNFPVSFPKEGDWT